MRLGLVIAAASAAWCAPFSSTAAAEAIDDGALAVTSSYTYTVDPAAGVVHVVADIALTNTVPNQITGNYINKTYFRGFSAPVPVEAVGVSAMQDGTPLTTTPDPVVADVPFSLVAIEFANNLFYNRTAAVVLTYDIAGGAPRDDSLTRINPAYTSFSAYGIADPGALTVRVVVPAGYVVDTLGSDAVATVDDGGNTVYTATDIAQPDEFNLFISARNDTALTTETRTVQTSEFVVKSWPDDIEWREFIYDRLDRGVPALEVLIGQPLPETDSIEIREAVTSYLYGYAGWYDSGSKSVELGEDLDAQTVVHELSHVWFNDRWFEDRWISEGLAQQYSGLANEQLGEPAVSPDAVDTTAAGAQPLNTWAIGDVTDAGREAEEFGYNAAWFVIDGIVDDIGVEAMQDVFAANADRDISYVGDGPAEELLITRDWRRFLDLTEVGEGSTVAQDLITSYVVTPDEEHLLTERAAARTAYDELDAAGGEWAPPLAVRKNMSWWRFDRATDLMASSTDVLAERDALAATLDELGVPMDPAIESEYESAPTSLDATVELLDDISADADAVVTTRDEALAGVRDLGIEPTPELTASYVTGESSLDEVDADLDEIIAATNEVGAAIDLVDADRGFLQRVGLYGTDVDASVEAAKTALADGDTVTARAAAAEATALIADSDDVGRGRVIVAAAGMAGVLLIVLAAIVLVRRRRRARRGTPPPEAGDAIDADTSDPGLDGSGPTSEPVAEASTAATAVTDAERWDAPSGPAVPRGDAW